MILLLGLFSPGGLVNRELYPRVPGHILEYSSTTPYTPQTTSPINNNPPTHSKVDPREVVVKESGVAAPVEFSVTVWYQKIYPLAQ